MCLYSIQYSAHDSISLQHSYDIRNNTTHRGIWMGTFFVEFIDWNCCVSSLQNNPLTDIKPAIAEPTSKVLPIGVDSDIVYHDTSIEDCQTIDPFSTYIKVPDSSNLMNSSTIMESITKNQSQYNFDVRSIGECWVFKKRDSIEDFFTYTSVCYIFVQSFSDFLSILKMG